MINVNSKGKFSIQEKETSLLTIKLNSVKPNE